MADDKIEIEIILDDGSIKRGFANIQKGADEVGKSVSQGFRVGALTEFNSALELIAKGQQLVAATFRFIGRAIDESIGQQEAITRFNFAIQQSGQFSQEAANNFLSFADALEQTSRFTDDAILENATLIQSLAQLDNQGLKRATQSAADLSTALGIDLSTASTLVAKAANGNVEAFRRYGIEIRKGSSDTETFANTLTELNRRFGGAAANSINTFAGQINILEKSFDNFLEQIGNFFTQSPALIETFKLIGETIKQFTVSLGTVGGEDFFRGIIVNLSVVSQAAIATVEQIASALNVVLNGIKLAIQSLAVLATAGLSDTLNSVLIDFKEDFDASVQALGQAGTDSPLIGFFDTLIDRISTTNGKLIETGINAGVGLSVAKQAADGFTFTMGNLQRVTLDVTQQVRQAFAQAAAQGIGAFIRAIRNGENALSAFGKAILGVFGDLAIQIGTTLIAAGLGLSALFELSGPKAIVAGLALIAIGTILKSLSGGSGASADTGGGASSSFAAGGTASTASEAPEQIQEKTTQVKIDVAGTVLSPLDVGRQIAQILNDTFDATGTKVVTA